MAEKGLYGIISWHGKYNTIMQLDWKILMFQNLVSRGSPRKENENYDKWSYCVNKHLLANARQHMIIN